MPKVTIRFALRLALGLAAGALAPVALTAQRAAGPLCEIGDGALQLAYFELTPAPGHAVPFTLRATVGLLEECPASFVRLFRQVAAQDPYAQDSGAVLRDAWVEAVRSVARDPADTDMRVLLAAAHARVVGSRDRHLAAFLAGLFEGGVEGSPPNRLFLDPLYERQALDLLRGYSRCGGDGCNAESQSLLFLLGTHPRAVLGAMQAESATAADWLDALADDVFSGDREFAVRFESARRAVLNKLSRTSAPGFEREKQRVTSRIRRIRYRVIE